MAWIGRKTLMKAMETSVVAEIDLNDLGKRLLSVPVVGRNKMMAFMSKHSPLEMLAGMNEKIMRKAIHKSKI
ncbi:MAG: hypothetical protein ACI8YW_000807 [Flavobacteriaceae bacterium]|jgi:hypothetical protein